MSDPRVETLATALHLAMTDVPGLGDRPELWREAAVKFLAALPPDWCGHADEIEWRRGIYREAAEWITDVQLHYCLGPEASPEDIFMVAKENAEEEIEPMRAALNAHHTGLTLAGDGAEKCAICAALAALDA